MSMRDNIFKQGYFWLTLLAGGFFLSLTLWFGLGGDHAICTYTAWVWKKYHLVPYVGVWDHNFPGIFMVHWLALSLFGTSTLGFRFFDFLVQLSCLGMIFYLAKLVSGSGRAGFLAGVFYSIYYYGMGDWNTAQRETYVFWIILICLVLSFSLASHFWLRALAVGLLSGFCFLVKPTYGLVWPVFGLLFLIDEFGKRPLMAWLTLLVFGICCLIPSLLVVFEYRRLGLLDELYNATIWFNFEIFNKMFLPGFFGRLSIFYSYLSDSPLILCAGFFSILSAFLRYEELKEKKAFWILLALIAVAVASTQFQAKNQPYHRMPFWGITVVFAGWGWHRIGDQLEKSGDGLLASFGPWLLYGAVVAMLISEINFDILKYSEKYYLRDFKRGYTSQLTTLGDDYKAADYLQPLLKPGDELGLFGWQPLIPLLLEKKLPTRYICIEFMLDRPGNREYQPIQRKWINDYISTTLKASPRFFIVEYPYAPNFKEALAQEFAEVQGDLNRNYQLLNKIGLIEIYQRKQ